MTHRFDRCSAAGRASAQCQRGIRGNSLALAISSLLAAAPPLALLAVTGATGMLMPLQVSAQDATSGEVFGRVVDDTGNPVAGIAVTLSDASRGFGATSTTGSDGVFRFARLANGNYVATVGDATREVRVSAGTVQTLTFTLAGEANAKTLEQVIVTGLAATSTSKDYYSQESGINIDIDNLLTRVPVPRNIFSAALLAPGTVGGDSTFGNLPSFSGSSVSENVYQINGYNSSDPRRFLGLMNQIPFEFFQQIDVKTGGFQAEYGRATGGIISLVTRSGTNDFTAGSNVFYTPEDLRAHSPDTDETFNSLDANKDVETNVWAGGALIKDRLFFYGLVSFRDNVTKDFEDIGTLDTTRDNDPFWGLNIDGVLLDDETWGRHSFTWTHIDDGRTTIDRQDGFDRDSRTVTPGDTVITRNRGGNTDIIKYTGVVRDWLTVSGLYGKSSNVTDTTSNKDANPRIVDRRSGSPVILGDSATTTFTPINANSREEYRFDADIFAQDLFGFGDHKFRLGFDHENLSSDEISRRSGNALYTYSIGAVPARFDPNGVFTGQRVELVTRDRRTTGGSFNTTYEALYAEDRWSVTDRLTLNLGVRSEDGENFAIDGSSFVKLSNQFDFRNGFTFDTFGDGTSRIYGFYGRTHQGVPNNTNVRLAGSEIFVREFFLLNGLNPDDTPITGQFLGQDQVSPLGIQNPKTLVSSTLKAQSQDEYILGFEKTFGLYTFGIKGTYRKLRAGIEDGAMDRGMRQFAIDNGLDVDAMADSFSGFSQFILFNPGSDVSFFTDAGNLAPDALAFLGGDPDGDGLVQVNLTADQIGVPKQRRRYSAIELTGERAFADGWSLQGSYTWSRLRGNSEGGPKSDIGQTDVGLTQDFDTAGLQINSQGRLPNDREHNFKLFGAYDVADGFTIGANFTLSSPRHFGCLGVLQSDPIASQFGAAAFTCDPDGENGPLPTVGTPRGSVLKSDWTKVLDMTFAFTPKLGLPAGLKNPEFRIDIFNILNSDDVTDREEVGEDPDSGDVNAAFGDATGFVTPRTVRFSVRLEF